MCQRLVLDWMDGIDIGIYQVGITRFDEPLPTLGSSFSILTMPLAGYRGFLRSNMYGIGHASLRLIPTPILTISLP